jgi:hypothetical protein
MHTGGGRYCGSCGQTLDAVMYPALRSGRFRRAAHLARGGAGDSATTDGAVHGAGFAPFAIDLPGAGALGVDVLAGYAQPAHDVLDEGCGRPVCV